MLRSFLCLDKRWGAIHDALCSDDEYMTLGWNKLDEFLVRGIGVGEDRGILRPSLIVLGAQPKSGKSLWARIVAEHRAAAGDWVYYLDFENGEKRLGRRMLCRKAEVSPGELKRALRGEGDAGIVGRVRDGEEWLRQNVMSRFMLCSDRDMTALQMRDDLDEMKQESPDRRIFVVVDSLQKLPLSGKPGERRTGIDMWLRKIEELRDDFNAVVLLISELKRPKEGEKYVASGVSFKESGDIEYTADIALTMTTMDDDRARLEVAYNRDGYTGDVADYVKVRPYYGMVEEDIVKNVEGEKKPRAVKTPVVDMALIEKLEPLKWVSIIEIGIAWNMKPEAAEKIVTEFTKLGWLVAMHGAYKRVK